MKVCIFRRSFSLVPALVILFACAKTDINTSGAHEALPIQILDESKLSDDQRALLAGYRSNETISYELARKIIIAEHVKHYPVGKDTPEALNGFLNDLIADAPDSIEALKPHYEAKLAQIHKAELNYEKSAVTLSHLSKENLMQCYSGTVMHTLAAQGSVIGGRYLQVVIFESGHVLSGYLHQVGSEWHLTGIETTAEGKALVHYGPYLAIAPKIRVVEARHFLMVEAFKYHLKNPGYVASAALRISGAMVGTDKYFAIGQEPIASNEMNYSPFQFGRSTVTPGKKARAKFDSIERKNLGDKVEGVEVWIMESRPETAVYGEGDHPQPPYFGSPQQNLRMMREFAKPDILARKIFPQDLRYFSRLTEGLEPSEITAGKLLEALESMNLSGRLDEYRKEANSLTRYFPAYPR